jgi:hypothetical protein
MVFPVLRWVWFPLCIVGTGTAFWIRWREGGVWGLFLPLVLLGL